jgi:hypothetical protein
VWGVPNADAAAPLTAGVLMRRDSLLGFRCARDAMRWSHKSPGERGVADFAAVSPFHSRPRPSTIL